MHSPITVYTFMSVESHLIGRLLTILAQNIKTQTALIDDGPLVK